MTRDADRVLGKRLTQCIRLPALDDDDHAFRPPAKGKLILAAGRLVKEKGFDVALRAFAQLADPDAWLAIVGEGEEREPLMALADQLGVGGRGAVARLRAGHPAMAGEGAGLPADLLLRRLCGGDRRGPGARGGPVVSTDCTPAARELLAGDQAGHVAPIGDAAGLAEGLRKVLAQPAPDPQALARSVDGYRIGPIAEDYLTVFDAVVAQRSGAPVLKSVVPSIFAIPGGRPAPARPATPQAAWRRSA
jgi:glycosyltransferase involved in cell wall biosynthesis